MSSTIFDQVRKLGNDILEGEEGQKLYAAQKAYENDPQAKALVEEYTKMKDEWQQIMSDPDGDKARLTELGDLIVKKEEEIKNAPTTKELLQAESDFTAFVNSVFNLLSATIQGQDVTSGACDPSSCASCSGCC
ncbi:MAG TPA: YlbF family regulator [Firmicutes bacterium]|nr:YlbF family regulator [Bacillota bacterium]